jgi:histidine triad (HIT) family protein
MNDCIFCKIRDGEITKEFTYQDEDIMVFPDINPIKPIHLLIVPKQHFADFSSLEDGNLKAKLFETVQKMAKEQGLEDKGYRIVVNGGGAQVVNHLHFHLLGPMGLKVGW